MICSRCGSDLPADSLFCDRCGAVVGAELEEGPSQDLYPPASLAPEHRNDFGADETPTGFTLREKGGGGRPQGSVPLTPPKTGSRPRPAERFLSLPHRARGLAAISIIAVLLLAAGFLWPGWFRTERRELSGPEQVVDAYFQAMARGDGAAVLDLYLPRDLEAAMRLRGISDRGQLDQSANENLNQAFPRGDLRLSGLEYESAVEGDEAVVRVIGGKATYTNESGEKVTETPQSGGNAFVQTEFRLLREEGRWYIAMQ